ncbi:MAG TPA: copper resistance protein CopC, partial [Actinomycetota bacterium]|nr:copper resistance protein CopC [Actinomycetota bacterium]
GEGRNPILSVERGAPGRWKVKYRTVSSIDGHLVAGSFSFHVGNKRPCREPEPGPTATVDVGAPGPSDDDDSGLPIVPAALAGAAIVGVALVIRRMGTA